MYSTAVKFGLGSNMFNQPYGTGITIGRHIHVQEANLKSYLNELGSSCILFIILSLINEIKLINIRTFYVSYFNNCTVLRLNLKYS